MNQTQGLPQRYSPRHAARVLVAEDDPEMRSLMAWALRRDGYQVEEAADGDEALRALGTIDDDELATADLVVTDLLMPGCTGFEMLEQLRRDSEKLPVIVVTAFANWETHARARRLGARILDKPFELDDLRKLVFDVLELR